MKMWKRSLTALLAVLMTIAAMPVTAFADEVSVSTLSLIHIFREELCKVRGQRSRKSTGICRSSAVIYMTGSSLRHGREMI